MVRTLKDVEARELRGHSLSSMEGVIWSFIPELDTHLTSGLSSSVIYGTTLGHLLGPLGADRAAVLVRTDDAPTHMLGEAQLSDER